MTTAVRDIQMVAMMLGALVQRSYYFNTRLFVFSYIYLFLNYEAAHFSTSVTAAMKLFRLIFLLIV